tara:strand:+ start:200 stop:436 length:237 start_codon:yes stop_codon:yes gene_type:complete
MSKQIKISSDNAKNLNKALVQLNKQFYGLPNYEPMKEDELIVALIDRDWRLWSKKRRSNYSQNGTLKSMLYVIQSINL